MNEKEKGRPADTAATLETAFIEQNSTHAAARIKTSLVNLALRGWIPWAVAGWLIRRGGLRHA
jgi:hypothetical protein